MRIFITVDYYFMIFSFITVGLIIGLVLYESKNIFSKKKKKINKKANTSKVVRKTTKSKTQSQVRKRKIS